MSNPASLPRGNTVQRSNIIALTPYPKTMDPKSVVIYPTHEKLRNGANMMQLQARRQAGLVKPVEATNSVADSRR
eukprot:5359039-Pyramimonas_sp.AAC.1